MNTYPHSLCFPLLLSSFFKKITIDKKKGDHQNSSLPSHLSPTHIQIHNQIKIYLLPSFEPNIYTLKLVSLQEESQYKIIFILRECLHGKKLHYYYFSLILLDV